MTLIELNLAMMNKYPMNIIIPHNITLCIFPTELIFTLTIKKRIITNRRIKNKDVLLINSVGS